MFGRATITLGIGPHSSLCTCFIMSHLYNVCKVIKIVPRALGYSA